ncbi:MAG: Com family DNA-binding transcriptional regulator [Candidatus Buchananbacteria bacterium]|nr:Com family DNA-binding transcriptional regulator [Candidatus Buchananbacteria bacterium]
MEQLYKEYRCPDCDKLLFKGLLVDSSVEIKCKRCKDLKIVKGEPANGWLCMKPGCPNRVKAQS